MSRLETEDRVTTQLQCQQSEEEWDPAHVMRVLSGLAVVSLLGLAAFAGPLFSFFELVGEEVE